MIIDRKTTFFLGIFIFIIPFLGFPSVGKAVLTIISGIFLVTLSVKLNIPKKQAKSRVHREKVTPVFVESVPVVSPKNDTIEVASQVSEPKPAHRRTRVTKKNNEPAI